jgi:hypothetical protein
MANLVLLAARRRQERFEAAGLGRQAERARKRVAELEKMERKESNLSELTVAELREKAATKEIEGRSGMSKDELVEALTEE